LKNFFNNLQTFLTKTTTKNQKELDQKELDLRDENVKNDVSTDASNIIPFRAKYEDLLENRLVEISECFEKIQEDKNCYKYLVEELVLKCYENMLKIEPNFEQLRLTKDFKTNHLPKLAENLGIQIIENFKQQLKKNVVIEIDGIFKKTFLVCCECALFIKNYIPKINFITKIKGISFDERIHKLDGKSIRISESIMPGLIANGFCISKQVVEVKIL
jgi:hypothetical protein